MHHDHCATLGSRLHGLQNLSVIAVEHTGVSHEQFETADAFMLGEVLHVFQRLIVNATNDLVECVVNCTFTSCFAMPLGKSVKDIFAISLHGHVDDCRDTAPGSCTRSSFKSVRCESSTERKFHVGVYVNATRNDIFAFGINDFVAALFG